MTQRSKERRAGGNKILTLHERRKAFMADLESIDSDDLPPDALDTQKA